MESLQNTMLRKKSALPISCLFIWNINFNQPRAGGPQQDQYGVAISEVPYFTKQETGRALFCTNVILGVFE